MPSWTSSATISNGWLLDVRRYGSNIVVPQGRFDAAAATSIDTESTGWKVLDITPLMQEWLEGSSQNYGVILTAPAAGGDIAATFYGSNHPDPLLRPWLEVSFAAPRDS